MNLKKFWILTFLIFVVLPTHKTWAQTTNAGFVSGGGIWYSKDQFSEGDKIKIYTAIFNPDTRQLSGTVDFFDNNTLLGQKNFIISGTSVKDTSVNWVVSVGDHTIYAKIENAKFLNSNGGYVDAKLPDDQTKSDSRTIKKKIIPQMSGTSSTNIAAVTDVSNIEKTIQDKTPDFISKPINLTAAKIEEVREGAATSIDSAKSSVNTQIQDLKKEQSGAAKKPNVVFTPFKYIWLFLLTILSFILNTKIVFYIILAICIFLLLRFIWRKIF